MIRTRRQLLALLSMPALPAAVLAQASPALQAAINAFTGGAPVIDGGIEVEIAELVENGNAVPVTLRVASPMSEADHVRELAIFTDRNPQPDVARFVLGPQSGRAWVSTSIRLATSQRVIVLARHADGRLQRRAVDVIVTLAACIE
jgi:sulfur-oxidizing protein SoxY